jgi:hypothetical protein
MSKSSKTPARKVVGRRAIRKAPGRVHRKSEHNAPHARVVAGGQQSGVRKTGKLGTVIAMLRRPRGASIAELSKATGWQAHSVRAAISATIKKKLGLDVQSEKVGDVRRYRVIDKAGS